MADIAIKTATVPRESTWIEDRQNGAVPAKKEPPAAIVTASPVVPNGGLQAWLQVTGAFFLYFNTWGLLSSYGSFQAFYESGLLKGRTAFQISTIGSLQSFLLVFLGFLTGPIYDAGYSQYLLAAGSFLIALGTVLQSFCTEFWQLLLAEGLCIGVGCGCLSILSVAITSLWFTTRLPVANGIAASGSGVGGVVFPIVIRSLLPKIGFGWTVRAIALIVIATLALTNLVLRCPKSAQKRRALVDRASLTDWPYILFVFGCFAVFLGLYTPFFYVQSFTVATGLASEDVAWYLVAAMNLASIPGRIVPNLFTHRLGPLNMICGTAIILAATGLGFLGARSVASVFAVAVVYGFFTGTFFALQPTVFVRLTSDLRLMGTRFGMAFSVLSIGLLFGNPISGELQRALGYGASWTWVGITATAGAGIIGLSRALKASGKIWISI